MASYVGCLIGCPIGRAIGQAIRRRDPSSRAIPPAGLFPPDLPGTLPDSSGSRPCSVREEYGRCNPPCRGTVLAQIQSYGPSTVYWSSPPGYVGQVPFVNDCPMNQICVGVVFASGHTNPISSLYVYSDRPIDLYPGPVVSDTFVVSMKCINEPPLPGIPSPN